jgi:hypothetical protein
MPGMCLSDIMIFQILTYARYLFTWNIPQCQQSVPKLSLNPFQKPIENDVLSEK